MENSTSRISRTIEKRSRIKKQAPIRLDEWVLFFYRGFIEALRK